MKRKTIVIGGGALAILILLGSWFVRPDSVAVAVVEVDTGTVEATVANTRAGTVEACRRAGLAPQAGGQIAHLSAHEGDRVQAGQVLLELWNDDLEANLTLVRHDATAARQQAEEACATADVAQKSADRKVELFARDLISAEARDIAVGEATATAAACAAAGSRIRVAEARIDVAREALERTLLRAPFDGTIAEINGEVGEFLTPSPVGIPTPPAIDLIDTSCLYITAPIDEVDAPAIRAGMPARITLDAFGDQTFPGTVHRIAPYVLDVERQARTVDIEAEIENPERFENLLPGYSADVEVILSVREDVLRVPTRAITNRDRVLVLEDGTIEERTIETGVSNWEYTEVVGGLEAGEVIVVSVDRDGVEPGVRARAE